MMRTTVVTVFCLLLAASLTDARRRRRSAGLELTVSPSNVVEGEAPEVLVSCQPPASLDDVFQPILLFLAHSHSGAVTPVVQETGAGTVVMATGNLTDRLSAEGNIKPDDSSFLTMTLADPQSSDSGVYSCRFVYLDTSFEVQKMEVDATLEVEQPNITEIIEIIPVPEVVVPVEVVEVIEEEEVCNCSTLRDEIDELRDTLVIDNAELRARLAEMPAVVPVGQVDARCQASFSARLSQRGIPLESGSTVPFNQAISNKGDAFDSSNGAFVAPCDGQYYFSLTLRSYQFMDSGNVEAALITGDGQTQVRTNVFIDHDRMHYETAGVTTVLTLSQGDEVKVKVSTTSTGQILGGEYTVFSGFYLF